MFTLTNPSVNTETCNVQAYNFSTPVTAKLVGQWQMTLARTLSYVDSWTWRTGRRSSTDRHAVGEVEEVVVVAEATTVVELPAGALAGIIVVPDVCVLARAGLGRQRAQRWRYRTGRGRTCSSTCSSGTCDDQWRIHVILRLTDFHLLYVTYWTLEYNAGWQWTLRPIYGP